MVENLKQHAYRNIKDLVPVDDQSAAGYPMLLPSVGADNLNYTTTYVQNANFPVQQGNLTIEPFSLLPFLLSL